MLSAPKTSLGWGDFAVLNSDKMLLDFLRFFLTSSTRTPKFVGKEFCYALVSFHGHGFSESLAAFGQSKDDCGDCLGHIEHLVNTHADVGGL